MTTDIRKNALAFVVSGVLVSACAQTAADRVLNPYSGDRTSGR